MIIKPMVPMVPMGCKSGIVTRNGLIGADSGCFWGDSGCFESARDRSAALRRIIVTRSVCRLVGNAAEMIWIECTTASTITTTGTAEVRELRTKPAQPTNPIAVTMLNSIVTTITLL